MLLDWRQYLQIKGLASAEFKKINRQLQQTNWRICTEGKFLRIQSGPLTTHLV